MAHGIELNSIMVCSWGYDQTNIDYYQVTAVTEKMVTLRKLKTRVVDSTSTSDRVAPVENEFDPHGKPIKRRVVVYDGVPRVKIESYASARPWDGQARHATSAMAGH